MTNLGELPVLVRLRVPWDSYAITAKSADGSEPPRTTLGGHLRSADRVPGIGSATSKLLRKGESVDQLLDLSYIWAFAEGEYTIGLARIVIVNDQSAFIKSETTISVPPGFSSDNACAAEAQQTNQAPRKAGPLRGEDVPNPSDEFERALEREIDFVATPATHHFVFAFRETLLGADLPGGMTLWNHGPLESVCVVKGETVRESLEKIEAARAILMVDGHSSVINVLDTRVSNFLETTIAKVRLPNPLSTPNAAITALLDSPEVKKQKDYLTLEDVGAPRLPPSMDSKDFTNQDGAMNLENTTVRQALNAIVQRLGSGIWILANGELVPPVAPSRLSCHSSRTIETRQLEIRNRPPEVACPT